MAVDKKSSIQKAIQARMVGDLKSVGRFCDTGRSQLQKGLLPLNDRVHLEILDSTTSKFEIDLQKRYTQFQKSTHHLNPRERDESFLFLYESTGFLIHSRNYLAALQFSIQAEEKCFDKNSWLSAHLNTLICYEALGIEVSDKLEALENDLTELLKSAANPKLIHEFYSMKLRLWFRNGQIDLIQKYQGPDLLYYKWLQCLPQLRWPENAKHLDLSLPRVKGSYSQFALNTLLYHLDDSDLINPPMNHWCDRLYLWTWTAFKEPQKVPLSTLLWLLENFHFEKFIDRMTQEDKIMVRHSLELLSIFDSNSSNSLNPFYQKLGHLKYDHHRFLANERVQIESFKNRHLNKSVTTFETPKTIQQQNLNYDLLKSWPFLNSLNETKKSSKKNTSKIKINLTHGRIDGPQESWCIYSETMAKAFNLFLSECKNSSVCLDDFIQAVLGFPKFDSFLHYRRVFNLLSRMKKIDTRAFNFNIRGNTIHFKINFSRYKMIDDTKTNGFNFFKWKLIIKRIRDNLTYSISYKDPQTKTVELTPFLLLHPQCTRAELQKASGWNKTMVLRQINKWIKTGSLKRKGKGKGTRYQLNELP